MNKIYFKVLSYLYLRKVRKNSLSLVYTKHAKDRASQRSVKKKDVLKILMSGTVTQIRQVEDNAKLRITSDLGTIVVDLNLNLLTLWR